MQSIVPVAALWPGTMEQGARVTLQVENPLYGGLFSTLFGPQLPFVLPGELVEITPAGVTVERPSPDRVEPGCIHFGTCGGCHYQQASYPAQLALKKRVLEDLLAAANLPSLPQPILHSAQPWHYRNRVRLRLGTVDGVLQAGYSRRGSNDFLPIRMCPIAAPLLWQAAERCLQLAAEYPAAARWLGAAAEIELFTAPASETAIDGPARLQLQLLMRAEAVRPSDSSFAAFCQLLRSSMPALAGAGASPEPDSSRRVRQSWPGVAWQSPGLAYPVAGHNYWVSRGAFFQSNRFLLETLVDTVLAGRSGALAWDLFAGVGLFTRPLAERFGRVVAVEGGQAAASDLIQAARNLPAIHPLHQPTLDFLRGAAMQRDRPDLVVLDPPRAGLGPEGAALLARIRPPAIVYVSCDPTTLSRDLAVLLPAGYEVEALHLVDLFPQTFHLETVVALRRASA